MIITSQVVVYHIEVISNYMAGDRWSTQQEIACQVISTVDINYHVS